MKAGVGRLPDFVGIGAQKSGTSWAHCQLRAHPGLFLPDQKELDYFIRNLPVSWYAAQFDTAHKNDMSCGEVSPNYFPRETVPERMYALIPGAKLFCLLRDPTSRAFSQYQMARKLGNIRPETPFITAFREDQRLLKTQGKYSVLLARYAKYYPLHDQLLVLLYEGIASSPENLMRTMYRYLDVDDFFVSPHLNDFVGATVNPETIDPVDAAEVRGYYLPYIEELEEYLGLDLQSWKRR